MYRIVLAALAALIVCAPPALAWTNPENIGGDIVGEVALVNEGTIGKKAYVIVGRNSSDEMVYVTSKNGQDWSKWKSLGGQITSSPTCTVRTPHIVDCWARGVGNDVVQNSRVNGKWLGWGSIGGQISGQPFAWASAENRLAVMAPAGDKIWINEWTNNWNGWRSLGHAANGFTKGSCGAMSGNGNYDLDELNYDLTYFCVLRLTNSKYGVYSTMKGGSALKPFNGIPDSRFSPSVYLQFQQAGTIATITVTGMDGHFMQGKYSLTDKAWSQEFTDIAEIYASGPSCIPGMCAGNAGSEIWVTRSK